MIKNQTFEIERDDNHGFLMGRCADHDGTFIFRWLDTHTMLRADIPVGVIKQFETFKALCRQFEHPLELQRWYQQKLIASQAKAITAAEKIIANETPRAK